MNARRRLRAFACIALLAAVSPSAACEKEDVERPPPARCMEPACGEVPPVTPGGGGDRDGGGGAADGSMADSAATDSGAAADQVRGSVVQLSNVVTRTGTSLGGAVVSADGASPVTSEASGAFVLDGVTARPPLYLTVRAAGALVETATLATSRTAARVFAIEQGFLVDEAAAVGATHTGTGAALFIRVVDSTGASRESVVVSSAPIGVGPFYDLAGTFERAATVTGAAGAIAFYEVPPGRPSVCVRDATDTAEACGEIPVRADAATFTTIVLP
ncbi:MAG: hypothetical protein IT379_30105 [Deltaproteobacteria bacterium]|nr:hypothetical protein [Deltaproteobacteria bacterium]